MRALPILLLFACICAAPASQPARTIEEKSQDLLDTWRASLDKEHLNYLVSPPYVIAGDGSAGRLEGYRDHTIVAATRALQSTFFEKNPDEPILILLFESAEPYQRLSTQWFGRAPDTPYGYFRRDGVMVMNVGTGTGTLVHELTHALIKPDFPAVPDWFNEGLGSLYEQARRMKNQPPFDLPPLWEKRKTRLDLKTPFKGRGICVRQVLLAGSTLPPSSDIEV